jgi:hypothetical protein
VAIGLSGLVMVAATLWLLVSGLGFLVVGAVLVIMVAFLAAASSRPSQVLFGPRRGTNRQERPAEELWRPGAWEEWTAERTNLQRQIAMLEHRNAVLAEQLRRVESQRWHRPIDQAPLAAD